MTGLTDTDLRTVLEEAKHKLAVSGWRQFTYGSPERGFCLVGAVEAAVDSTALDGGWVQAQEACRALAECLGVEPGFNVPSFIIISWNDTTGRTLNEVNDLIDRTLTGDCPPPEKGTSS